MTQDAKTMIVPLILVRMKEELQEKMAFEVPEGDPTRAVLVKVGRFQDNPVEQNVSISISGGDFEDPSYIDGRIDHDDLQDIGIRNLPVAEIGGGFHWWRRGTINFQAFFVRQRFDEETAMNYAYSFYARLLSAVENILVGDLEDDYGERSFSKIMLESASFYESGGKDKYIWRGKLRFRCLTRRLV